MDIKQDVTTKALWFALRHPPKLPTGGQPFFTQGYSHHMCQLRCFF